MIFFKKRKEAHDQFRNVIEERLSGLESEVVGERKVTLELKETAQTLQQNINQLGIEIRKNNMAFEDVLDALEERTKREARDDERIHQLEESERQLLSLIVGYQDSLWQMKRFAGQEESAWMQQLKMVEEKVDLSICGIMIIKETDIGVNYQQHEVVEVKNTSDKEKAQKVAIVYNTGVIYKGEVLQKAKVAAYRYDEAQ